MNTLHDFGLLTMAEVAELLHCSKAHVCKAVAGRVRGCPPIPAVSLGRRKLVRRETLLSWIERNEQAATGATIPVIASSGCRETRIGEIECANGTQQEVSRSNVAAGSACGGSMAGGKAGCSASSRTCRRRRRGRRSTDRGRRERQAADEQSLEVWRVRRAGLFPLLQPEVEGLDAGKQREPGIGPSGCGVRGSGAFKLPAR